jgi:hypothetical protein
MNEQPILGPDGSTADELVAALPSFVKRDESLGEYGYQYWAPERTHNAAYDHAQGRAYFNAALAYCQRLKNPGLLIVVANAMQGGLVDHVECGFAEAFAQQVMVGALPDFLSEEQIDPDVRADPELLAQFRDNEASAVLLRDLSRIEQSPIPLIAFMGECFLGTRGRLTGGAARMLGTAAYNGSMH